MHYSKIPEIIDIFNPSDYQILFFNLFDWLFDLFDKNIWLFLHNVDRVCLSSKEMHAFMWPHLTANSFQYVHFTFRLSSHIYINNLIQRVVALVQEWRKVAGKVYVMPLTTYN